jgi:hypothetical protein
VHVQDDTRPRAPGGAQRTGAEQRVDVVSVQNVGAVPAYRDRDLVRVEAAGQHAGAGPQAPTRTREVTARAFEHGDLVPAGLEQSRDRAHRALLPAGLAVPVV